MSIAKRSVLNPALAARDLTKVYRSGEVGVNAQRSVDFELYPHEIGVLLDPSGSGNPPY